jgi:hypothetical protein
VKHELIAFVLALTMMSWAQSTTPNQTQTRVPEQKSAPAGPKAACPCCDKMASADHKGEPACMHPNATAKDGKGAMSCCAAKDATDAAPGCSGKDGKSCSTDDKAGTACCGDGKCGEGHEMPCCADKAGKKAAHNCCGGQQRGNHSQHEHPAPGN